MHVSDRRIGQQRITTKPTTALVPRTDATLGGGNITGRMHEAYTPVFRLLGKISSKNAPFSILAGINPQTIQVSMKSL